ncbi:TPA: hypothetical protein DCS34_01830 [Candidatus Peribacteria bacterium]|nr:MAG: hypothetical protein A2529_04990 [Candidatus Peribacteria bacterium RIFOXYD2_FULL_58_15]HAS34031.1 hypothetical protein [Candidatus Peribacteria bacterium]
MMLLWFAIGIGLPTLVGWLLVRLAEGNTPVLTPLERWTLGFVFGLTGTMFVTFCVHLLHAVSFTRAGFLAVQLGLVTVLGIPWLVLRRHWPSPPPLTPPPSGIRLPRWALYCFGGLGLWTLLKTAIAAATFLLLTPPAFDDVVDNWNFRGKVFFVLKKFVIDFSGDHTGAEGIGSYPPTVSMVKTMVASLAGTWNEALVNGVHLLWYVAVLLLVFALLRRAAGTLWAFIGTYLLASLPLELIQATSPYADIFLSTHLFAAIGLLFLATLAPSSAKRLSWLRLSGLALALLIFTKNEALLLFIPLLIILTAAVLTWFLKTGRLAIPDIVRSILLDGLWLALIAVPWIGFKWANGLTFGNAHAVSGLTLAWQEGVLTSVWINTFFEGNWIFLFPILIGLLLLRRSDAFRSPIVLFSSFFLILFAGQLLLYLFTFLSTEALYQTGYARGLIQLAPIIVTIVTLLLAWNEDLRKEA